ncbi:MAG: hypothetical protein M1825_002573 [Sarcosagium campestre]|nr:MAG: hypothetical protein M1825_002573 [Sarcosagium campestre]
MSSEPPLHTSSSGISEIIPPQFALDLEAFPGRLPPPPLSSIVPIHRRRRSTKNSMPAIVKRSASTPNVRAQALADAASMSMSAADKRRNKLGYHRTSVACGHCRRRKIRCLLAPDDPQGRCSNCIRLKKDCNFFPVDQQPQPDRRPRTGSKTGQSSGPTSNSSSSPSPTSRSGGDSFADYHPIPISSAPPNFSMHHVPPHRNGSVPSMNKQLPSDAPPARSQLSQMHTPSSASFEFSQSERTSAWTVPSYVESPISGGPRSAFEDGSGSFWRLPESPMTPAFTSYAQQPGITAVHRDSVNAYYGRDDMGWQVPTRAMSYGQVEGLPLNNYPGGYSVHHNNNDYKQPPHSAMYPPSLNTSDTSMASLSEPSSAPADGRHPNSFSMQAPPPPPSWNPNFMGTTAAAINGLSAKGADGLAGWYQEPGHLAQVDEEGPGPLNEDPSMFFQPNAQSAN